MNRCLHKGVIGDNYGTSCSKCEDRLSGYGFGGWFGENIQDELQECIHVFFSYYDGEEVCIYCEQARKVSTRSVAKRLTPRL